MFSWKLSRVSLVLPVYNEAERLAACLDSIARQTFKPYEVIVVDNNSTDESAAIASSYPFVRLIHELKQGVVHARNTGFNAAKGDIIGRIDADTVLPKNWTQSVALLFADPALDAVSGAITYHDIPFSKFFSRIELFFRQSIANGMRDEVFLFGANMAMRTSVWKAIRTNVCNTSGIHEDFDLAIHAHEAGFTNRFDRRLHAYISLRRFDTGYMDFFKYVLLNPASYARHGKRSQRHMYPMIILILVAYKPIKMLFKGYDPHSNRYSLVKALKRNEQNRVNPATFVD